MHQGKGRLIAAGKWREQADRVPPEWWDMGTTPDDQLRHSVRMSQAGSWLGHVLEEPNNPM
jgi:hypothetical protein